MLNVSTFPCPSCREFISTGVSICRFCSEPIDLQAAIIAVKLQNKVNRACNDANLVRSLAGAMWVSFFVSHIPFMGFVGTIATFVLFALVPVRLIMWQVRFGGIQTADLDYKRAKRRILVALGFWLLAIIVGLLMVLSAGDDAVSGNG